MIFQKYTEGCRVDYVDEPRQTVISYSWCTVVFHFPVFVWTWQIYFRMRTKPELARMSWSPKWYENFFFDSIFYHTARQRAFETS